MNGHDAVRAIQRDHRRRVTSHRTGPDYCAAGDYARIGEALGVSRQAAWERFSKGVRALAELDAATDQHRLDRIMDTYR